MGSARMYPLSDDSVQTYLDRYMPMQAGRIVRPDEIYDVCGDPVISQDELKRWQNRHKDDSCQMDIGNGMIGVKVYFSAREDPEQVVIKDKWKKRRGKDGH